MDLPEIDDREPLESEDKFIDYIPSDLEDAIRAFTDNLSTDSINYIKSLRTTDEIDSMVCTCASMGMRNNWRLWEPETQLATWFRETLGLGHADDTSAIVIKSAIFRIRGEFFDLDREIKHYHDFWIEQGVDPKTQAEIDPKKQKRSIIRWLIRPFYE